jgi:hypothetical protein
MKLSTHFLLALVVLALALHSKATKLKAQKNHFINEHSISLGLSQYDGDYGSQIMQFNKGNNIQLAAGLRHFLNNKLYFDLSTSYNHLSMESQGSNRTPPSGANSFSTHQLQLNSNFGYHDINGKWFGFKWVTPFVESGVFSGIALQKSNSYQLNAGLNTGLGIQKNLSQDKVLRLGARYHWFLFGSSRDKIEGSLATNGINHSFDQARQDEFLQLYISLGFLRLRKSTPSTLDKLDTDQDGILDTFDLCPDAAGPLETAGCPDQDQDGIADKDDLCQNVAGAISAYGCPDIDLDGITNVYDLCPETAGMPPHGCPDTDLDGVFDHNDTCPNTFGLPSLNGCNTLTVYFDFDIYDQLVNSEDQFDKFITDLKNLEINYELLIEGYADEMGSNKYNFQLSIRRAEFIKEKISINLANYRNLHVVAYGESKSKELDNRLNRKVKISIINAAHSNVSQPKE